MSIQALSIHQWGYGAEFHNSLNILSRVFFRFSIYNFYDLFFF